MWRQVERAYPDLDSDKRARLLDDAAFVDVELLGGAAWAYHFSDGHCCTIREVEGRAWLWPDGHVEVGPARIVSTRHVPC